MKEMRENVVRTEQAKGEVRPLKTSVKNRMLGIFVRQRRQSVMIRRLMGVWLTSLDITIRTVTVMMKIRKLPEIPRTCNPESSSGRLVVFHMPGKKSKSVFLLVLRDTARYSESLSLRDCGSMLSLRDFGSMF